ncbi:HtaA domain-containing protein [Amycolatopsis pithecellobii]|uniref:Htaa domain-containing protein n=1 Tax=Amycolatopsis pithecellobii TaxID=664692 RepID=A0A6N7Z4X3_9PSEU|nr:HtaA domain-containing protein [Amycolatopsis pithecellobii]MTD55611.1 hypothetical protein [Amycolatopsis pithecellobii]
MTTPAAAFGPHYGDLVWGVLETFVNYVRAVQGNVILIAPAAETVDGRFRFPLLGVEGRTAKFGGGVRFVAHGGALTLAIEQPWITTTPGSPHRRLLSVQGTRATNSEGSRLVFADLHPDNSAVLTPEATVAFDFRYQAGIALAPVDLAHRHEDGRNP